MSSLVQLVQLVRRYPLSAFAVLACLFGWLVYGLAFAGIGSNPENMPLGPVMAALVVTSCQGRAALFAWGRTLRRWAASPWLYAVAVGVPIALHVLLVLVNHLLGAPLPTAGQLGAWPEIPVTFLVMLVMVGLGEEAGWTAFAAPILLRRHGLWGAFAVLAPLRIFWHLPLMIAGDMPVVVGLLGNAGFQLIVLQMMRHRRGSWTHAAVWHAMLNAFGGAFFFTMVTGADKDRLGVLLGLVYAIVASLTLIPALLRRGRNDQDPTDHRKPSLHRRLISPRPGDRRRVHGRLSPGLCTRDGATKVLGRLRDDVPELRVASARRGLCSHPVTPAVHVVQRVIDRDVHHVRDAPHDLPKPQALRPGYPATAVNEPLNLSDSFFQRHPPDFGEG